MTVDADAAAAALADAWVRLFEGFTNGWVRREGGLVAAVSRVPIPTLNGVWAVGEVSGRPAAEELLGQVAAEGFPYCLQLRVDADSALTDLAVARGMSLAGSTPLMVLEDGTGLNRAGVVAGLVVRQLSQDEAELHAHVMALGFEAPEPLFAQLMTPSVLALPGVRCYVGEVDGEAVTTGLGVSIGAAVGVFNIATPPAHRRRGYGAAVTARAVLDGLADGASWAWLQSSQAGYSVYEHMGFRTVESWPCWVSTAGA